MNVACLTEFQCAVYADGELPPQESREMSEHLEVCASCRNLIGALRVESRVLVECFQATDFIEFELEDEALSEPQAKNLGLVRFTAFVLAMSVLLRPVLDFLDEFRLPDVVNWLAIGVEYVVPAGIAFTQSIWNNASWIALAAVLFLSIVFFSRRSALSNSILSVLALLTVFSSSSYGIDIRSGKPVAVPQGETLDDTLIAAGDHVTVDGTVTGDVIAFAREVTIRGEVKGNVVSFARQIDIEGTVGGSVTGFAQYLRTRGQMQHNLYAFGQSIDVDSRARIAENVMVFASESSIEGKVGKDVQAWTNSINVSEPARIDGALTARTARQGQARIAPGTVSGRTDIRIPAPRPSRYWTFSFYVWQTIWLTAAFLTGLILFWLFPQFSRASFNTMRELLMSAGFGFLALVALPVAAVIAMITLVGLPLGIIALCCWFTAGYLAKIVVAGFLGRSLLGIGADPSKALVLLAGLVPIFIATNLPYIGALINFFVVLLGLGAIVIGAYQTPRWRSAPAA
jgi:cytoskeletal protein CcmA (bactofilin family)/predicted anti-sigma-YlaC factor YlaD